MVDITRIFDSQSQSVLSFFQQRGLVGYYIPMYQREYSWDAENIEQLIEDICSGVSEIADGSTSDSIHFMGALILVTEDRKKPTIQLNDQKALPGQIDKVIDGQQRIATIAILACQLYRKIYQLSKNMSKDKKFRDHRQEIQEIIDLYLPDLETLFSVNIRVGKPPLKPIIIRESVDQWTFEGGDDNYKSDIASYLSQFIRAIYSNSKNSNFPQPPPSSLVGKNIRKINDLLKEVAKAHEQSKPNFPAAWDILEYIDQLDFWSYERPELVQRLQAHSAPMSAQMSAQDRKICTLVQLLAFCYYLLKRCCFTVIKATSDIRAFDMFQSLNATGTPLTAFETFRPLVVNYVESTGNKYKDSKSEKYLEPVDRLLNSTKSASDKSKLTDEFLTLFSLTSDGEKLSKKFSAQRRWLNSSYEKASSPKKEEDQKKKEEFISQKKEEFISQMGKTAIYRSRVVGFNPSSSAVIPGIESIDEREKSLATLCILFLQSANHKMPHAVLSRFYSKIIQDDNDENAKIEFAKACKMVVAFFVLWRSTSSNAGLDKVYRKLLKEHLCWQKGDQNLSTKFLSDRLKSELENKGIDTEDKWVSRAKSYLRYDEASVVCRFVLFVVAEDTIPDSEATGLMKIGTQNSTPPYLTPERWISNELESVEHIAPQNPNPDSSWDEKLYGHDKCYQRIGNLTLLPLEINSSLRNKGWTEKYIYYRHLSETNQTNLSELASLAQSEQIQLNPQVLDRLKKTSINHHILPIVEIPINGEWNKELVDRRSERICQILWDRLYPWISLDQVEGA